MSTLELVKSDSEPIMQLEELTRIVDLESEAEQCKQATEMSFRRFGAILSEINESRLYRQNYKTFEEYVRGRWSMSPGRAYQIIEAMETYRVISTVVEISSERALREVSGLPDDDKIKTGKEIVRRGITDPTPKQVREAAIKVSPKKAEQAKAGIARQEAKLEKKRQNDERLRAIADRKRFEKEERERIADAKQKAKELAAEAKKNKRKSPAPPISSRGDGGLFAELQRSKASQAKAEPASASAPKLPSEAILEWYTDHKSKLNKKPVASPDSIVRQVVKILRGLEK